MRRIIYFTLLTFTLSWSLVAIFLALGGSFEGISALIVGVIYMYMPTLSVVILQKLNKDSFKGFGLRFNPNRWWLVAWLLPPALAMITVIVSAAFPGVELTENISAFLERFQDILGPERIEQVREQLEKLPIHLFWISILSGMAYGATVNAVAAFGEEFGWRGFLLKELRHFNFWKASLIIGLI